MCGIIAAVGNDNVIPTIIKGLKRLEYRGYDSAGIAVLEGKGFKTVKRQGKVGELEAEIAKKKNLASGIGIGHTRWATHGKPNQINAHPHASSKVCVVHNGIVENAAEIKSKLLKNGAKFLSQTDTEVIPHLIEFYLNKGESPREAVISSAAEIKGNFAFAVIFKGHSDMIIGAKRGSPLLACYGKNENYIASDFYALGDKSSRSVFLEDDEFVMITQNKITIFDQSNREIAREPKFIEPNEAKVGKDGFKHFMLKEIYEQPRVIEETIETYADLSANTINLPKFPFDLTKINKIVIIACGTSYYAGLVAKYLIEEIAACEVEVEIASEFRYRKYPFRKTKDCLMVFISQSGETADTIAALKFAKANHQDILSIVNVATSSMAHLSSAIIRTVAGPEIGVASTKAYTAQVAVLALFAIELGYQRKAVSGAQKHALLIQIAESALKINAILSEDSIKNIAKIAKGLIDARQLLYVARGVSYINCLEGALKFRELSYISAQGIAAGELKHGTIAMIDNKVPVIAIAPDNNLFEKTASNLEEVKARDGNIILITSKKSAEHFKKLAKKIIVIEETNGMIEEVLTTIVPIQLIAYYSALFKGNDVDQPRNLAKSVTVE